MGLAFWTGPWGHLLDVGAAQGWAIQPPTPLPHAVVLVVCVFSLDAQGAVWDRFSRSSSSRSPPVVSAAAAAEVSKPHLLGAPLKVEIR